MELYAKSRCLEVSLLCGLYSRMSCGLYSRVNFKLFCALKFNNKYLKYNIDIISYMPKYIDIFDISYNHFITNILLIIQYYHSKLTIESLN